MEPITIATILGYVTSIVTSAISWVTSYVGVITSNPLVVLFVVFGFVGTGVGLIRRLIKL